MVKLGDASGWGKLGGGGSQPKCQTCGKPLKDSKYNLCWDCSQKKREGGGNLNMDVSLPGECVFNTFYDAKNFLKREIFIESAEKAAKTFMDAGISQTSIRNLFHLVKAMDNRQRSEKTLDFGLVREAFFKFHRQVVYNVNRKGDKGPLLHPVFKDFTDRHLDVATKDGREYSGFVEYLTSILARLKTK